MRNSFYYTIRSRRAIHTANFSGSYFLIKNKLEQYGLICLETFYGNEDPTIHFGWKTSTKRRQNNVVFSSGHIINWISTLQADRRLGKFKRLIFIVKTRIKGSVVGHGNITYKWIKFSFVHCIKEISSKQFQRKRK